MMKKFTLAVVVSLCCAFLAGCNTVHGLGKDIESGGKEIEKASGKGQQ